MSQMNKILNVNPLSGVLICEAGCILKHLDDHLSQHGLIMPIDLGAKDSCQIGGNLATNAGGLRLLKYGSLRGTVLGLEAVLPSGQIIDCMNTMRKDNTGYDLKQLFIGSEGTLGIITKVCIHCPPRPKDTNVAFFGCDTFEEVIEAYKHAKELLGETLSAFEFMDKESMISVNKNLGYSVPQELIKNGPLDLADKFSNFYCLIENSGCSELYNKEILEKFCHHLHNILKPAISNDKTMKIVIAQNLGQARMLWKLRESITLSLVSDGYVYKYDISLPLTDFYKLIKDIRAKLLPLGNKIIRVVGYGHVGDGNLHLNVTSKKFYREVLNEIQPYIYQKVTESLQHENKIKRSNCSFEYNLNSTRGSISAEHGLGLVKKEFSYLGKSAVYWRCAQKLKNLFDPIFILNPYKMLNTDHYNS
ncbi:D-2-hydroxyglutarate dehydrogenase, mitochondrial-like isoform X5 [Gordionus sp. m RMFG-2023]|uniref:D-2-hydroxyglutarate dehydrogenase, mitochondrial-like isoform X5 n=1 Tax=Gordionus sp. m RMFG-2023 TaxID=3053472 RepID=UPI0031FD3284